MPCGLCHKNGHNRATCPSKKARQSKRRPSSPALNASAAADGGAPSKLRAVSSPAHPNTPTRAASERARERRSSERGSSAAGAGEERETRSLRKGISGRPALESNAASSPRSPSLRSSADGDEPRGGRSGMRRSGGAAPSPSLKDSLASSSESGGDDARIPSHRMARHAFKPPARASPHRTETMAANSIKLVPYDMPYSARLAFYISIFDGGRIAALDPSVTVGVKRSRRSAYSNEDVRRAAKDGSGAPQQLAGRGVETGIQFFIDEAVCGWTPFDAVWVDPDSGSSHFVRVVDIVPNKRRQHQRQSKPTSCQMIYANAAVIRLKYEHGRGERESLSESVDEEMVKYSHNLDYGGDTVWSLGPPQRACVWDIYPTYLDTSSGRNNVRDPTHGSPSELMATYYATAFEHVRFFWDWLWDGAEDPYLLSHHPFLPELQMRLHDAYTALDRPIS